MKKKAKKSPAKKKTAKKAKRAVKKVVRKIARKVAKKAVKKIAKKAKAPKAIGRVTHFYNHIKVAVVKFSMPVKKGTKVRFLGATTDFSQDLSSMQYEHKAVTLAKKGQSMGVKVAKRVREGDKIFLPER